MARPKRNSSTKKSSAPVIKSRRLSHALSKQKEVAEESFLDSDGAEELQPRPQQRRRRRPRTPENVGSSDSVHIEEVSAMDVSQESMHIETCNSTIPNRQVDPLEGSITPPRELCDDLDVRIEPESDSGTLHETHKNATATPALPKSQVHSLLETPFQLSSMLTETPPRQANRRRQPDPPGQHSLLETPFALSLIPSTQDVRKDLAPALPAPDYTMSPFDWGQSASQPEAGFGAATPVMADTSSLSGDRASLVVQLDEESQDSQERKRAASETIANEFEEPGAFTVTKFTLSGNKDHDDNLFRSCVTLAVHYEPVPKKLLKDRFPW